MASPEPPAAADPRILQVSPRDNVGMAKTDLPAGETVRIGGESVVLATPIRTGHKLALAPVAAGQKVLKYNAPIGTATCDVRPGDYVHTHNLTSNHLPTYTLDGTNPYLPRER